MSILNFFAATILVTSTSDDATMSGTLPYAILNSSTGDTIDCSAIAGMTITLLEPLPAIAHDLIITLPTASTHVTIAAAGFQAFSVASGAVTIQNFVVSGATSTGGAGGAGYGGGGGGVGGGGGLYVHSGSNVTLTALSFQSDQAVGGAGGNGVSADSHSGGGGGGFGGGAGGADGGGGGGGNSGGGAGGSSAVGVNGQFFGGGGGGGLSNAGGTSPVGTTLTANTGGTSTSNNGGGGAGASTTAGSLGTGGNASTTSGGSGGIGIGIDSNFGGGGGGAGDTGNSGGNGAGTGGGGGGANNSSGGAGGDSGGGGGGGGGSGGFGAGAGGITSGSAATSLYGGGSGGVGAGSGGGGGAALGGAIFIGNSATLTIGDPPTGEVVFSGNSVTAGAAGTGGSPAATAGTALSNDLFLSSGGYLVFNNSDALTISSVIGSDQGAGGGSGGGVTMQGSGMLTLTGVNTYTASTTIRSGTLQIAADNNLGVSSNSVTLSGGTLQINASSFSSARPISLSSGSTIDTQAFGASLSGAMTGAGSITKLGASTLTLTGTNTYSGGTTITAGTISGAPTSLQGNISVGASGTALFTVSSNGTYSGSLSGSGDVIKQGGATLFVTGNSSSYTGTFALQAGTLNVSGALGNSSSTLNVSSGATLSGRGSVGTVNSSGEIIAGNSGSGTLSILGALTLTSSATVTVVATPTSTGLLAVTGAANLSDATLGLTLTPGFYGFQQTHTILTSSALSGTFGALVYNSPGAIASLSYPSNTVLLTINFPTPFLNFPFANDNERAVGTNIDQLNVAGAIPTGSDLAFVVDDLAGQSIATINDALNQMHPANYSAFAELQVESGSQLISLFCRPPYLSCGCRHSGTLWIEPFGNWFAEKNVGEQTGFGARVEGIAAGFGREIFDRWIIGLGGAWQQGRLSWRHNRGHGEIHSLLGAFYSDYRNDSLYFGAAVLAGVDSRFVSRHIDFVNIDRHAEADTRAVDVMAEMSATYFFGVPSFTLYPYMNFGIYYLGTEAIQETGASGLNLTVDSRTDKTLRTEGGLGLQVLDMNYRETMCIAPLLQLGWVMENPIGRHPYASRFSQMPIPFETKGWDQTWQLWIARLGLQIRYCNVSLSGDYTAQVSIESDDFFAQMGNVRLDISF